MFWKKKNKEDFTNIIGLTNTRDIEFSKSGDLLLTFSQALICFLLCVGSICGYASCFSAQFNLGFVLGVLAVASTVIAYARNLKSKLLKNVIYIGFLFLFAYFIIQNFRDVNSGYHALVNMTYASLENYLEIPALVYYEELIEDSYSTITMFLTFLGLFELLLYHMWIGERIHLLSLFLVSFGLYIIPLFINLYPEDLYVVFLLTAYLALTMICLSFHINNHPTKKKDYLVFTKKNPWSARIKGFSYGANGRNYFMTTIISFVMAISVMAIVGIISPRATYQNNMRTSNLKASVTDEVKYMVTFGLSGYINRYEATGGINDGRLGGIHSVRPDYETDLTVTFVPVSYEPMYLRGFVGVGYTDRQWYSIDSLNRADLISSEAYNTIKKNIFLENEFAYLKDINLGLSPYKISVKNVDASFLYDYTPYYSSPDAVGVGSDDGFGTLMHSFYYYTPNANNNTYLDSENIMSEYLQVPSTTHSDIVNFLIENDLCTEYIGENGVKKDYTTTEISTILAELSDCLTNDFVYSMNPGITPRKEEFVKHFLENKKGFCAHFATSATLILRTLGVPARYVEGYVVTTDDLATGEILENANPQDYLAPSFVETNRHVVQADIGDDKAHAWVEYYTPEFGWRVFEATTASMEMSANSDFWSSLYGLLREADTADSTTNLNGGAGISSGNLSRFLYRLLLIVTCVILVGFVLYISYKLTKQYRSYHRNRMNINVRNFYKLICGAVSRKHPEFAYLISYQEQFEFLATHYKLSKSFTPKNTDKLCHVLEQAAFSNEEITNTEFAFSMKLLRLLRRNVCLHF